MTSWSRLSTLDRAPSRRRYRLLCVVTTINVTLSAGFSVATLIIPQDMLPMGVHACQASALFTPYAAVRSVALAGVTLGAILMGYTSGVAVLAMLALCIQIMDAGLGAIHHKTVQVLGPLVLAALQASALKVIRASPAP